MATNPRGVGFWAMVLIVVAIITGVGVYAIRLRQLGFGTRSQPSVVEAFLAKKSRSWAIPERARLLKNPLPASDEMLAHGRNHWADHCAKDSNVDVTVKEYKNGCMSSPGNPDCAPLFANLGLAFGANLARPQTVFRVGDLQKTSKSKQQ